MNKWSGQDFKMMKINPMSKNSVTVNLKIKTVTKVSFG